MLYCLENIASPLHVRTDSAYVQLGIEQWMQEWRAKAWYKHPQRCEEIDHADLWQKVSDHVLKRVPGDFKISWVKGHAMPKHIHLELTTELDIWGNNAADILAGKASAA